MIEKASLRRRRTALRNHMEATVYTRTGCCLCDDAKSLLERYGFCVHEIDIDENPELVAQHGECVPVVAIDGKVRFRGRIDEVLLNRLLSGRR